MTPLQYNTLLVCAVLGSTTLSILCIEASQNNDGSFPYSFPLVLLITSSLKAMISGIAIVLHLNHIWPFNRPAAATPSTPMNAIDEEKAQQSGHASTHMDHDDDDDPFRQPLQWRNLLLTLASASLYAINDTLVFVVMMYFISSEYTVLVTGKIVIVALLSRIVLRRKLQTQQYIACVLLVCGIVTFQYKFCSDPKQSSNVEGYFVVLVAEMIGGGAGILNEWILKQQPTFPVHYSNFFLYVSSIIILLPLTLIWESKHLSSLFRKFSPLVLTIVVANSVRGICISLLYKRTTNMTKIFIVVPGILLTWVFSAIYFDWQFSMQSVLAIFIIGSAVFLFFVSHDTPLPPLGAAGAGYSNIAAQALPAHASLPRDEDSAFSIADNDDDTSTNHTNTMSLATTETHTVAAAAVLPSSSSLSSSRVEAKKNSKNKTLRAPSSSSAVATDNEELQLELELAEVNMDQNHVMSSATNDHYNDEL